MGYLSVWIFRRQPQRIQQGLQGRWMEHQGDVPHSLHHVHVCTRPAAVALRVDQSANVAELQAKLEDIAGEENELKRTLGHQVKKVVSVAAMHWENAHEHMGEAYRRVNMRHHALYARHTGR